MTIRRALLRASGALRLGAVTVLVPCVVLVAAPSALAAPLDKRPSPDPSTSATANASPSSASSPSSSASPSPTGSAAPAPKHTNNPHYSPSPTATATSTARPGSPTPAPSPTATPAGPPGQVKKHSPSPSPSKPSPAATALVAPPVADPQRPAASPPPFIGPVAPPFIGPVVPKHLTKPSAVQPTPQAKPVRSVAPTAGPAQALPREAGVVPGKDVLPVVQTIVQRSVSHPETPIALGLIVLLFLLVQHRIDRRDPKLRAAPKGQSDELRFGGVIGLT